MKFETANPSSQSNSASFHAIVNTPIDAEWFRLSPHLLTIETGVFASYGGLKLTLKCCSGHSASIGIKRSR